MRSCLLVGSALALLGSVAVGCAPPKATGGGGELVVYANGSAQSLRLEGTRAWGPAAELKRFDDAYRGTLYGRYVDLHFVGDRVTGMVGASRVDIHVSEVDGKVHGQGLLGGHISTFDVGDTTLEGSFGMCSYQMKRNEKDDYLGWRSCRGAAFPVSRVTIPASIRKLPALDQATLYALMLTG